MRLLSPDRLGDAKNVCVCVSTFLGFSFCPFRMKEPKEFQHSAMDELVYTEDLASRCSRVGVHELAYRPPPPCFLSVILQIQTLYLLLFVLGGGGGGWGVGQSQLSREAGNTRRQPGLGFVRSWPLSFFFFFFYLCQWTNEPMGF